MVTQVNKAVLSVFVFQQLETWRLLVELFKGPIALGNAVLQCLADNVNVVNLH